MLDSATHRNDHSMKNMHTFSCLHGIEDRLFHLRACSPERQRQIAKAGVSAGTHSLNMNSHIQDPRQLLSLCVCDVTDHQVLSVKPSNVWLVRMASDMFQQLHGETIDDGGLSARMHKHQSAHILGS